jgi:hypothetical protein
VLHDFIADHRDEVLHRTAKGLLAEQPERSVVELLDHLPSFLEEICIALASDIGRGGPTPAPGSSFIALELADQRHNLGMGIDLLARASA